MNKIFKLHIREKLAIAFVGLSILPVLIVGMVGISLNVRSLRQVAIEDLRHELQTTQDRLEDFFHSMEDHVYLLTSSTTFKNFLNASIRRNDHEIDNALKDLLPDLIQYAEYKKIFYQIKYVDRDGDILFTIEDHQGVYNILPREKSDDVGMAFYLYLARRRPRNSAMFIPVELRNTQSGKLFPAISCIYPLDNNRFEGLLIFYIYAKDFFKLLEEKPPRSPSGTVMLVNSEGYFLYHSEKKKEWNKLLASKEVLNLKSEYGDEMTNRLLSDDAQTVIEIGDQIIAHSPVFTWHEGIGSSYTLIKSVSKSYIFAPVNTFKWVFVSLLGFFLLLSLFLSYLTTRGITNPIKKLQREAEVIAKGNYRSRVKVKTFDEIGELARQFNTMAQSLEQHEAKVSRHKQLLRDQVQQRTKELQGEKDKLQIILDNVPSGFMLLDRDYNILSASAALVGITGKSIEKLVGQQCSVVTGCSADRSSCITTRVFSTGKMQLELSSHVRSDGEERYLENLSIPLKRNGQVENVLEIITDVTERKRMQDRLIRSGKLATAGEIAAVIAHGIRNSLTSVRIILQLYAQNDTVDSAEKESFEVALNSIEQMENLVNELLHLARPTEINKQSANINDIILDSINFARHQILGENIDINVNLASDIPELLLDSVHLKEALVNLILNASQAIENHGKITISSTRQILRTELRDLAEISASPADSDSVHIQEVVIKKGTQIIQLDLKDTGAGIGENNLPRIFDPFFTTRPNGTGLGLSIVKRVINEHGGIIRAQSKPGTGCCFSIYLPVMVRKEQ
ncbi:MAG: PAS domain-containing protein [Calditrichaeota bacterium]|nr:PAS domain-containing protein [Calditrichota bacterium]